MKKGSRKTLFVCSAYDNSKKQLISKAVEADTRDSAVSSFKDQNSIDAEIILGPFFLKKTNVLNQEINIKFSGESKKAIYNDWYVKAMMLSHPNEFAYVFYDKRIDDKKAQKPVSNLVRIEELKFIK